MYNAAVPRTLVCLHGWGGSSESFTELRSALADADLQILTPDLPGFGTAQEPDRPWNVEDYVAWLERYLTANVVGPYELLGHSHGGRVAIAFCSRVSHPAPRIPHPDHLYLCAAAGIRHPRHVKRIFGLMLAKLGRWLLGIPGLKALQPLGRKALYRLVRVHDYERASPTMQQTIIKVSAQDLRPLLHEIMIPTDIFWGTDDGMTPIGDALLMHREIPRSALHTFPGVRHRVHRDCAPQIAAVIRATPAAVPAL